MGILIDLTAVPDCKTCADPTKYVIGSNIDLEGPGQVGVLYGCKNRVCRTKRTFLLRRILNDGKGNENINL